VDSKAIKQNFWKENYEKITKELLAINWRNQFVAKTVEEMWSVFKSELLRHIEENVPFKKEYRPKKKNYISKATIKHMKKRGIAWKHIDSFHQERITKSTRKSEMK